MLTLAVLAVAGLGMAGWAIPGGGVPAPNATAHMGWFSRLPEPVPEASSLALLIVGMAAVGVSVRRRQARVAAEQAGAAPPVTDATPAGSQGGQAGTP
jgi:hypothetical protein